MSYSPLAAISPCDSPDTSSSRKQDQPETPVNATAEQCNVVRFGDADVSHAGGKLAGRAVQSGVSLIQGTEDSDDHAPSHRFRASTFVSLVMSGTSMTDRQHGNAQLT